MIIKITKILTGASLVLTAAGFLANANATDGKKVVPDKPSMISADFPFESKYVEIMGSKMHYVDEGLGDPILFLHGNPTSSYLWRNIIPYVPNGSRAIAVDLIGMGKSDKPDIDYSYADHAKYLDAFIKKLDLRNITLVVHDWGSGLGFNYAAKHEDNVKGLVFMESLIKPYTWETLPAGATEMLRKIRTPDVGEEMLVNKNFFVEGFLPSAIIRPLSEEEKNNYRAPYQTLKSRKPILVWPREIPISGEPQNVHTIVSNYEQWLLTTSVPKLLLYANPGIMIKQAEVEWVQKNMKNVDAVYVGEGLHFIQEDNPDAIGEAISSWYQKLPNTFSE